MERLHRNHCKSNALLNVLGHLSLHAALLSGIYERGMALSFRPRCQVNIRKQWDGPLLT